MRNDMRNIYSTKQGQTHMEKGLQGFKDFYYTGKYN